MARSSRRGRFGHGEPGRARSSPATSSATSAFGLAGAAELHHVHAQIVRPRRAPGPTSLAERQDIGWRGRHGIIRDWPIVPRLGVPAEGGARRAHEAITPGRGRPRRSRGGRRGRWGRGRGAGRGCRPRRPCTVRVEIPEEVEQLVAGRLVGRRKGDRCGGCVRRRGRRRTPDRCGARTSTGQLSFPGECEGAGWGDALDEVGGGAAPGGVGDEARVVEVDAGRNLDARVGDGAECVAAQADVVGGGTRYAEARRRGGQGKRGKSSAPGGGGAVEEGHLGPIDVEGNAFVDAQTREGCKGMLTVPTRSAPLHASTVVARAVEIPASSWTAAWTLPDRRRTAPGTARSTTRAGAPE